MVAECSKLYAKIYQSFVVYKHGFSIQSSACFTQKTINMFERMFDESLIWFIKQILQEYIHVKWHIMLDLELSRFFKTSHFNTQQRNYIAEKVKSDHPHVTQNVKLDKTNKMIEEWESINSLQKQNDLQSNYTKHYDTEMNEYRPNNIKISKLTRMRSPFIDNLIPSKELTLEKLTRGQTKRKYQKSSEPTSVTCNSLM